MIEVDEVLNVKMRSDVLYILKSKQKQNNPNPKCWNIYTLQLKELYFTEWL